MQEASLTNIHGLAQRFGFPAGWFKAEAEAGRNDPHPDNPLLHVRDRDADPLGPTAWRVTAGYRFGEFLGDDDPLNERPKYRQDYEYETVPVDRDVDNNPIKNSAGDSIEGLTDTRQILVLYVVVNQPSFSLATAEAYNDHVNDRPLVLAGQGTIEGGRALLRYMKVAGEWSPGDPFVRVEYCIAIKVGLDPWDWFVRDQGEMGWYDDAGTKKKGAIMQPNGTKPPGDVLLDGTGKPIDPDLKILKDEDTRELVAPVAPPSLPANLLVDATRSTAAAKVLQWWKTNDANFDLLPIF